LGSTSFAQNPPKQPTQKNTRDVVGVEKGADDKSDEYAYDHAWQSNRPPVKHPKHPIIREPGGLHLLKIEDGLALPLHLACQLTQPARGLLWRVTRLCPSLPEHALDIALEDLSLLVRDGASS
jgi:hypothetical protein